MLNKFLSSTIIFLFCSPFVWAQNQLKDSLFVLHKNNELLLTHTVQKDETVYTIASCYSVPSVVLSRQNDLSFYDQLAQGRVLHIPLGNYNFSQTRVDDLWKPVYFVLDNAPSTFTQLAQKLQLDEASLQNANHGLVQNPLLIGWVHIQMPQSPLEKPSIENNSISGAMLGVKQGVKKMKDTVKMPPSELELIYNYQTSDGKFVDSLEGTVVFYKPQTSVSSQLLFGFSNDLAKGRVVKVINPSNRKFVFIKIIANLPNTKQYLNAKLGIDGRAMPILGIREPKLWCTMHLKY